MKHILPLVCLLLSGCDMQGWIVNMAIEACLEHGGVNHISRGLGGIYVTCNTGHKMRLVTEPAERHLP